MNNKSPKTHDPTCVKIIIESKMNLAKVLIKFRNLSFFIKGTIPMKGRKFLRYSNRILA